MRRFTLLQLTFGLMIAVPLAHNVAGEKEAGFEPIFNGKNFDGWRGKKDKDSLDGKTEAYKGRFKIADGVITIDPAVKGDAYIETAKEFDKDVTIKLDIKPGAGCNNDFFLRGTKFDIVAKQLKSLKDNEWNTLEIIVTGDKIEHKINGESARKSDAKSKSSTFVIRAEFGTMQIKNIRVK